MLSKKSLSLFLLPVLGIASFGFLATGLSSESKDIKEASAAYTPSTHYSVSDTASELASYYSSITTQTGSSLLSALRSLNSTKRKKTMGYSTMGTSASTSPYVYTDYPLGTTSTDSNGQIRGSSIASFYTKTTATSFNKEHVWPNSHGGENVEADILHTRPTISSENSSRGNSFYVEGKNSSSAGWDPYTASYDAECRGECARIILYCVVAYSGFTLSASDSHSTSNANPDNMMGNINTLIKWHFTYAPNQYEINRNNGAEYLQGNRNPFVDHPEYASRIWGQNDSAVPGASSSIASTVNNTYGSTYTSWVAGSYVSYGGSPSDTATTPDGQEVTSNSVSISKSTASLNVGGTTTIYATSSDSSNITWTTSDSNVVSISSNSSISGSSGTITLTGVSAGSATITAKATIESTQYTASCIVTVTSSGDSGGGSSIGESGTYTIGWGTATGTTGTYSNFTATSGSVSGLLSFESAKNSASSAPAYNASSSELRLYFNSSGDGGSITITPESGVTITGFVMTTSTSPSVSYSVNSGTATSVSASSNTYTVTGISASTSLEIQNVNTSNTQLRIKTIALSYTSSGGSGGGSTTSDSVTLEDTTLSLTVGGSATIGYTASGTVTWSTSNSSVATVSNGVVTAVGAGSATITATCGSATATCSVTVTASSSTTETTYQLVTDSLSAGDTVVIVGSLNSAYYYMTAGAKSSTLPWYIVGNSITPSNNKITGESLTEWTVGKSGTYFTFTNNNIDLYGYVNGTHYSLNLGPTYTMNSTTTNVVNSYSGVNTWTYTITDASTGAATLVANSSASVYLEYYNGSFCGYKNAPTSGSIFIYRKVSSTETAETFATYFLANSGCNANGTTAPTISWSTMKSRYQALESSEQSTLTNATANKSGTTIQQCVARYDYIVGKYGTTKYEDFMGRNPEPLGINNPNLFNFGSNTNTTTLVVVLVSALSITAISVIIFIKKGKRD